VDSRLQDILVYSSELECKGEGQSTGFHPFLLPETNSIFPESSNNDLLRTAKENSEVESRRAPEKKFLLLPVFRGNFQQRLLRGRSTVE
jgi:hypothetical protein